MKLSFLNSPLVTLCGLVSTIMILVSCSADGETNITVGPKSDTDDKKEYRVIENESSTRGKITIGVTDASFDAYAHVYATLDDFILVDTTTDTQVAVDLDQKTFDLLDLRDREKIAFAGTSEVNARMYDEISFRVEEVILVDSDGQEYSTTTQELYTLPLDVRAEASSHSFILLDFELDKSQIEESDDFELDNGDFIFRPSILVEVHTDAQVRVSSDQDILLDGGIVHSQLRVTPSVSSESVVEIRSVGSASLIGTVGVDGGLDLVDDIRDGSDDQEGTSSTTSSDVTTSTRVDLDDTSIDAETDLGIDV